MPIQIKDFEEYLENEKKSRLAYGQATEKHILTYETMYADFLSNKVVQRLKPKPLNYFNECTDSLAFLMNEVKEYSSISVIQQTGHDFLKYLKFLQCVIVETLLSTSSGDAWNRILCLPLIIGGFPLRLAYFQQHKRPLKPVSGDIDFFLPVHFCSCAPSFRQAEFLRMAQNLELRFYDYARLTNSHNNITRNFSTLVESYKEFQNSFYSFTGVAQGLSDLLRKFTPSHVSQEWNNRINIILFHVEDLSTEALWGSFDIKNCKSLLDVDSGMVYSPYLNETAANKLIWDPEPNYVIERILGYNKDFTLCTDDWSVKKIFLVKALERCSRNPNAFSISEINIVKEFKHCLEGSN